ncbi:family 16 glycosylhydrolase [Thalassotalea euphylliae]|uniref:family 16 glycosylhydrolase n=1 Tax=Thalassotalea euphylliae TaxID=1655234 RepID=UPI003636EC69
MKTISKITPLAIATALVVSGCGGSDGSSSNVSDNIAPKINSVPITDLAVGTAYTYQLDVNDSDGDTLSYQATVLPSWLSFNAETGELSGTPSQSDVGSHQVSISISDGTVTVEHEFTVVVSIASGQWQLTWSDEFDGSGLNTDNWNIETGDGSQYGIPGWGNNELEWYQEDNVTVANGNLVIEAREEASNGYDYTSARLRTDGKVDIQYGRIEARIKIPEGQGLWPAFWMLPTDSQYGGWASGGEIDIMEVVNPLSTEENHVHGTIHYGMAWPLNVSSGKELTADVLSDFNVYAIEWEENEIRWFFNDVHYATVTSDTWWSYFYKDTETGYVSDEAAPFNQSFHLLLNMAVGGNWPGSPDAATQFPAQMLVDYVRVYECDADNADGSGCFSNVDNSVEPAPANSPHIAQYDLFSDEANALAWEINGETLTRDLSISVAWDNSGAITAQTIDVGGEQGTVLDIVTTDKGNVAIYAQDGETFALKGMGDSSQPWMLHAAELKFDVYVEAANTDLDSQFIVKMDSGWPALGQKVMNFADVKTGEWQTISVPVNELIATPGEQAVNLNNVLNLFVLEFSAFAHVQVDNVQLICGHKDANGCGINPPAQSVTIDTLVVFDDEVNNDTWNNGIGAWDTAINRDYTNNSGNFVSWDVTASDDAARGNVLNVSFGSASGIDGLLYIQSDPAVDLGSFASGELVFDIKVNDYAETSNGISFKVDCVYPCTTGDQLLGVIADGEWQTVRIPVSSLVSNGLDLSQVNTGLVIFPTWGDQAGVDFSLDNIRWVSTASPSEPPAVEGDIVIYAESFDSNWTFWDCCGGASYQQVVDSDNGNVVEVSFAGAPTVIGASATSPVNAATLDNATIEFDFKMATPPSDSSADWLIKVESANASQFAEIRLDQSVEGHAPIQGQWQHYTFNVSELASLGLDPSSIKLILVFPTWSKANGAVYQIDNIVIKSN